MVVVITLAISPAATFGPSSAILMIPRLEYWPAGSTDIWVNATLQDLWPDRLVPPFLGDRAMDGADRQPARMAPLSRLVA